MRENYLYAMITIREIVHGLMLFVDNANAGFVGANGYGFDVFGRLALFFEVGMD